MPPANNRFGDNLSRLIGMHALSAKQAAVTLGLSPNSFTAWRTGGRTPSTAVLMKLASFFEVDAFLLHSGDPQELIQSAAEPERFETVEKKIRRALSGLKPVELGKPEAGTE